MRSEKCIKKGVYDYTKKIKIYKKPLAFNCNNSMPSAPNNKPT
jgi:hypothetical protein